MSAEFDNLLVLDINTREVIAVQPGFFLPPYRVIETEVPPDGRFDTQFSEPGSGNEPFEWQVEIATVTDGPRLYAEYLGTNADGDIFFTSTEDGLEGRLLMLTNNGDAYPLGTIISRSDIDFSSPFAICFYPGTRIATPAGERAIETLAPGDLVLTQDGAAQAIRWVGRQTVSTRFADPLRVLPIRIRAGALGDGLPRRDLLVSPAHALLLDGVLVEAGALVNGSTITREAAVPEVFTWWNLELPEHTLILAEGAAAETFVDNVSREHFDNWAEHEALADAAPIEEMDLPRASSARQVPRATRRRLDAIAGGAAALAA
jgi:hypothetical protein